jgi:septation ring formation regulator EzrA
MDNNAEKLVSEFREELDKLKPAIQLLGAMTAFSSDIQQKAVKIWDTSVTTIEELKKLAVKDVGEAKSKLVVLQGQINLLITDLNSLTRTLENSNLPGRLGRMEDNLATLNTSIQNLYGRLDFMELNLREEQKKNQVIAENTLRQLGELKKIILVLILFNMFLTIFTFMILYFK